jgi:uncharacterized protein YndB with AHSA1/START domain
MNSTSLRITRIIKAERERVFDALTRASEMSSWFVVDPSWSARATNELRVGGSYRIEMDRGDGTIFVAFGEYLEIDPPERLVFTWSSAIPAVQRSIVTIVLTVVGTATEVDLTHDLLPDTDEGRAHAVGWQGSLDNLERFLTG